MKMDTITHVPTWTDNERSAWRPAERLTVTEWADRHRYLDAKTSAEPGKYSSARTPYTIQWQNSANCSWVKQCTVIAGTQLGKTETLNNVLGFAVHQDPAPAMVVMPRNPDVRLATQRRIMPMILASPALRAELTEHEHDVKNVEIAFRRSIIYVRSSQSPADLASVPVRYLLADEVDKFPKWSGDEAAPLDLARERQKTFWNSIAFVTTTPTTRDATGWSEYEDGDQRAYHVPCPECNGYQVLEFGQVSYPEGATARDVERGEAVVVYACKLCGVTIPDNAKPAMLTAGVWVPKAFTFEEWIATGQAADREPHRSYHLPSLYSPWLTWADMAAQWLKSKDKAQRLQNWVNSWLAEPWEDKVDAPTLTDIDNAKVAGWTHVSGKIPAGVLVATAGADVQKDGIWAVVRGWGWNGQTWLLYAAKVATFDDLEDVLFRNEWTPPGSSMSGIRVGFIDSRHRRSDCLEFVRKNPAMKMAQGVDRTSALDFTSQKLEKHPDTGEPLKRGVRIWSLTVSRFKDTHAEAMRDPDKWHVPEDVSDDYKRQVTAEHKIRKRVRNHEREMWVVKPGSKANHLLDCEVYATAAGKLIQVERLRRDPDGDSGPPKPPTTRPPLPPPPRSPRPPIPSLQYPARR